MRGNKILNGSNQNMWIFSEVLKNMDTDCVIHFKDKVFIEEKKRQFTEVTFKKFLDCRKEWLSLESDYKGFVTVARDSLDKVPVDASDINQIQNKSYHVSLL